MFSPQRRRRKVFYLVCHNRPGTANKKTALAAVGGPRQPSTQPPDTTPEEFNLPVFGNSSEVVTAAQRKEWS